MYSVAQDEAQLPSAPKGTDTQASIKAKQQGEVVKLGPYSLFCVRQGNERRREGWVVVKAAR